MGELPLLVGVGSICRRNVSDRAWLLTVVDALDRALLPAHHLE